MKEFLEKIKDIFIGLKDKLLEFYEENKKLSIIILSSIIVILVCLILLIALVSKKDKEPKKVPGQELVLTEKLVVPNGPELPRDYNTSRQTKDKQAVLLSLGYEDKEIEALSKSNDNLINEIIGAAP